MEQADTETPATAAAQADVETTVHETTASDGAELALTRVRPPVPESLEGPVALLHGTYTNRGFWITEDGFGLGPSLARHGFDVWIPELRGHGLSPKGGGFQGTTAEDHIRLDVPAVHRAVVEQGGSRPMWVGHSAGGLFLLAALSRRWIDPDEVEALAVFGTQVSQGEEYLENRLVASALKAVLDLIGHLPAPLLGLGPEIEPAAEMKEMIDWKAQDRWVDREGRSYRDGLADLDLPFRSYAGGADTTDPPEGCRELFDRVGGAQKTFQLLSTDEGFSQDYDHVDMIASRAASREVWPDLRDWLSQHS